MSSEATPSGLPAGTVAAGSESSSSGTDCIVINFPASSEEKTTSPTASSSDSPPSSPVCSSVLQPLSREAFRAKHQAEADCHKKCSGCHRFLPISVFVSIKTSFDRNGNPCRHTRCNECRNKRQLEIPSVKLKLTYLDTEKAKPCLDCGRTFPAVCMDFDHVRGGKKEFNVSQMWRWVSMARLVEEIEKCDLVCSNCHRIRTSSRGFLKTWHRRTKAEILAGIQRDAADIPAPICSAPVDTDGDAA